MNMPVKLSQAPALQMSEDELANVLSTSLYPGASMPSIKLVIGYCKASGLDPMQKPVHIVPMWDSKSGSMRDVIMPGINLYRIQASRSGECAGVSEPEFGPDVTEKIGGQETTYPSWCRVTVRRILSSGQIAEFTARELWKENYAVKGGKEKSTAPNTMWAKRPYGQIAKCAEAQAFRKAFPELASAYTADEMEGKAIGGDEKDVTPAIDRQPAFDAIEKCQSMDELQKAWGDIYKQFGPDKLITEAKDRKKNELMKPVSEQPAKEKDAFLQGLEELDRAATN